MSRPWIFICPSSRGIGFHLTRYLLQTTAFPILATTRSQCETLRARLLNSLPSSTDPSRLELLPLDVTSEPTIAAAAAFATNRFPSDRFHLHLAFALPGVLRPERSPGQINGESALEMMRVNVVGVELLMKHFGGFLPRKGASRALALGLDWGQGKGRLPDQALWVNMGARVGSISDNRLGGWFSYRASKAGLHSLTKSMDHWLRSRSGDRAMVVAYHPGTVKTDLSREFWESSAAGGTLMEPETAVKKMTGVIAALKLEQRGKCWDWKGKEVPP